MKKVWNFVTKTVGTIVIISGFMITILAIVDYLLRKSEMKHIENDYSFDDDWEDDFFDDFDDESEYSEVQDTVDTTNKEEPIKDKKESKSNKK